MMSTGVSVIATVKNERRSIGRFLDALLEQTRSPDEIILADGGSTDGTVEEVEQRRRRSSIAIRLIDAPGSNIAEGRNLAIGHAAGPIIAASDAGTVPSPDWLAQLVRPLIDDPSLAVSSGFYLPGGSSWLERTLSVVITPQLPEIDRDAFLPSSRSVAFRKQWWERAGGYPEWLDHCEDLVFDRALDRAGARFAFAPDAVVDWNARPNLRAFARQYFNYARGDGHADLYPARHALRYGAYATGVALLVQARRRPAVLLPLAAGGAAYLSKFWRRVRRMPPAETEAGNVAALALMPVIVVTGDVAKMFGYPLGRLERNGRRAGFERSRT